jgi:thioester reductase-like protein
MGNSYVRSGSAKPLRASESIPIDHGASNDVDAIAVIGIGCRLPAEINSAAEFWDFLAAGKSAIGEVPPSRWSLDRHYHADAEHPMTQHVRNGGFISDIEQFDATFFGISPREAMCMDPQQRLMMEVAWQALEDAGYPLDKINRQRVGVFVGISSNDYGSLLWASEEEFAFPYNETFALPGNAGCIAANRLSYFFDLKGPSLTVDTACSSSLVAVHLACESIRRGESEMAFVGGVQALIHPGIQTTFCKAGLLAPDGLCKSFDASANGYVRAEGAGMVLLKPYEQASADGDQIYAVIRGSAVNSDGRSNGMVAPNLCAQIDCVRQAFAKAGIDPSLTQYVEAHGPGTRQGDPIEMRALGTVLSEHRTDDMPACRVGSVKTNLGHSETAAGITGLIKSVLCLHRRQLPPSLNFKNPNPSIDFLGLKMTVQTELSSFPSPERELIAGVSSFGFGGTNAHIVLSEAANVRPRPLNHGHQPPLHLLTISARTATARSTLAGRYLKLLRQQPALAIQDLSASTNLQRTAFRDRTVCIASDRASLMQQLELLSLGQTPIKGLIQGQASRRPGKLAWLFTGQGSQCPGMAAELLRHHPTFREAFDRVCNLLDPHLELTLKSLICSDEGQDSKVAATLASTGYTQPALFAVGYALSQLWLAWGVEPDLLIGHSIGEVLAAHLADVFSLEDASRLVIARSRLMQALPGNGGMAAVLCPPERLIPWLAEQPDVAIAAFNGPANTVISGPMEPLQQVINRAKAAGLEVRPLQVSHAFHSPAMAPMLADFEMELARITYSAPTRILISNLTGKVAGVEIATPDYWCKHVIQPVLFHQGIQATQEQGAQAFLEIGARPTLIAMARQCLDDPTLSFLPSLLPGESDWKSMYTTLGQLFVEGHTISWEGFNSPFQHRRVQLPGYPFEKQAYWWSRRGEQPGTRLWVDHIGPAGGMNSAISLTVANKAQRYATQVDQLELIDLPSAERHYRRMVSAAQPADLNDHRIRGIVVFPAAGFIDQCLDVLQQEQLPLRLSNLVLEQPLKLEEGGIPLVLELHPDPDGGPAQLSFHSRPTINGNGRWMCHGQVQLPDPKATLQRQPFALEPTPVEVSPLNLEGFYRALDHFGLGYGPSYRALERLVHRAGIAWAELRRPQGASDRGLIDGCFQAVAALIDPTASAGQLMLPVGLAAMELKTRDLPDRFSCQVRLRPSLEPAFVVCDLVLHQEGIILGWIDGFQLRRLPRQALEWLFPVSEESAISEKSPCAWLIDRYWTRLPPVAEMVPGQAGHLIHPPLLIGRETARAETLANWCARQSLTLQAIPLDQEPPEGQGDVLIWPELGRITTAEAIAGLCCLVLKVLQQLTAGPVRPVWLVLEGSGAAQGALEGLIKTAALEYPQIRWTQLNLPTTVEDQPGRDDWGTIWLNASAEASLLWRDGQPEALRLQRTMLRDRFRLGTHALGSLDDLRWQQLPAFSLAPGDVEVAVEVTGLNFRDVLNALGLLAAYSAQLGIDASAKVPFGGECVGRITAVGPGVDPGLIGQRVIAALAVGSLASHVLCRAELCIPLPESFSPELGASVSTVFLTAIYALVNLAALQPGEIVLIHAAAGGVGQAALQIARSRGARILATASQAKRSHLLEQGVEVVFDSRSLDFADAVLRHTDGRGVDVVLNSLKGEWVDASFRALTAGGRFVELGKIEIWSRETARERRPDARYLPFDLLEVAAADPLLVRQLLINLLEKFERGELHPIPIQVFPLERTVEAFRLLAQAKHVGKVVIRQELRPKPLTIRANATYLVTGAFGGIGLQLLEWLAAKGATSIIAVSRSANTPSEPALALLERLSEAGVHCRPLAIDLAAEGDEATKAVCILREAQGNLPADQPLAGVFHAAGVLDDGLIASQTAERMQRVLQPKIGGWQILHAGLSADSFFVSFSSMAAMLGSPGQVGYSAANGALDGDCQEHSERPADDAPVYLSLQWGPWAGAGMAGSLSEKDRRRFESFGIGLLEPADAFIALEIALQRGRSGQLGVLNNNWLHIAKQSSARQASFLAPLIEGVSEQESDSGGRSREALLQELDASPETQHHRIVVTTLQTNLGRVMGLDDPSTIDPAESLFHIGLDSLMAVELAAMIQNDLGVKLELESLAGDPTLEAMGHTVLAALRDPVGTTIRTLDLARDAQLPADWEIAQSQTIGSPPGEEILFTGASGFLGAYLLAGQLERWPDLRVRCLVRCLNPEHGLERIRSNLQQYGIWNAAWEGRVVAIPGDLSLPSFGMNAEAFNALVDGVGGILHNGAHLSQMASYSRLAPTNVEGTRQILQIAVQSGGLPVQMISSISVFEAAVYRNKEIDETADIESWEGIYNGYSQTKWVSERLVAHAGRLGLPVTIFRPPLIGGDSRTGAWHQDDLLYRLLQGCLELGMAADVPWELDLVPVDYVANAVSALAWLQESNGRNFHLHHPNPLPLISLLNGLIDKGSHLRVVSMQEWLDAIEMAPGNPLHNMRAFFTRRWGPEQLTYPELNQVGQRARPSNHLTVEALKPHGVRCPSFEELLVPYGAALLHGGMT